MSIDFDMARWEHVRRESNAWWAGELKRPLISILVRGRDPGRPPPVLPLSSVTAPFDLSIPPEAIVDYWDYQLSCCKFFGSAIPQVWPDFGPGIVAAFLGADLHITPDSGTVWFGPAVEKEIADLHFKYDPDNVWGRRIIDIYRACIDRWQGMVQVGMTDLGGTLDVLSAFRPGDQLLLDLYDHPNEVTRLTWEVHEFWWCYFDELNAILQPVNPGYSAWSGFYSQDPHYMLQCDFSYMIGPDMFEEFVRPELAASCRRITNSFYHLDGTGQLPHLDSLLSIPELKGIQWVPGAGNPDLKHWPQVYRKIRNGGKLAQLFGEPDTLDVLAEQLGSVQGMILLTECGDEQQARDLLEKYGAR